MKINRYIKAVLLALVGLALASFVPRTSAQTLTTSYTNDFDLGGNTNDFSNSGSVASWIQWYGVGGGNAHMTNDVTMDSAGQTNTSGSLQVYLPFGASGDQGVFFGTFENYYNYDRTITANGLLYSNITFKIHVLPGLATNSSGNFGTIQTGLIGYNEPNGGQFYGSGLTIPASATNGWVTLSQPIDYTDPYVTKVEGVDFKYTSYSGYPKFPFTFWIDNLQVNLNPGPPPPPPVLSNLKPVVPGLNCIATFPGAAGNRYHIATTNDIGYGFIDQPNVTYSWTIASFPTNQVGGFQQHLFFVNGAPGQYDEAADYNLADCIFLTVQQSSYNTLTTNGSVITTNTTTNAVFNFRYKTNEPSGNGMLFNGYAPTLSNSLPTYTTNTNTMVVTTNAPVNSNFWPVMPVVQLYAATTIGTWTISFSNKTNVTMTGPGGVSTNFVFDSASAALFADPMTLLLGAQPNNTNGVGQAVVYSDFSITGNDNPFDDHFATDSTLNTAIWKASLANDTNGVIVAPPTSVYWLDWTLPDAGFSLQTTGHLPATTWTPLSPITIQDNGARQALIDSSYLPATNQGYFSLVERSYSQLIVLFPGETLAPNTPTGKTGTPTPVPGGGSAYAPTTVTVVAVDSSFNPVSGISDVLTITSSDTAIVKPNTPPALVNGTVTFGVAFSQVETATVTATDSTTGFTATSSSVSVTP